MTALIAYIIALFFLGIGNAVITYHVIRYRDPGDIAGFLLTFYYALVITILISTALLVDWQQIFG